MGGTCHDRNEFPAGNSACQNLGLAALVVEGGQTPLRSKKAGLRPVNSAPDAIHPGGIGLKWSGAEEFQLVLGAVLLIRRRYVIFRIGITERLDINHLAADSPAKDLAVFFRQATNLVFLANDGSQAGFLVVQISGRGIPRTGHHPVIIQSATEISANGNGRLIGAEVAVLAPGDDKITANIRRGHLRGGRQKDESKKR